MSISQEISEKVAVNANDSSCSLERDELEVAPYLTEILCSDNYDEELKTHIVTIIKELFNKGSRITLEAKLFHHLSLDEILDHVVQVQNNDNISMDDMCIVDYCDAILKYGKVVGDINEILKTQLDWGICCLKRNNSNLLKVLISKIWDCFKINSVFCANLTDKIVNDSKEHLEKIVLEWMKGKINNINNDDDCSDLAYFIRLSVHSPKSFQLITSIMNEFVIYTNGDVRIINVVSYFVNSVLNLCDKSNQDFFRLYPKDCFCLVSYLVIKPDMYMSPDFKSNYLNEKTVSAQLVINLLYEKYVCDKHVVLMLLTHYPEWIDLFLNYIRDH